MNKPIVLAIMLLLMAGLSAQTVLTCRDVQFTESISGDSPYNGQTVTVEGIVVAEKLYTGSTDANYGFLISDPEGGPWSGLLIFTNRYFPARGDKVRVTGGITEYYGLTEMTSVSGYQVISAGNTLPNPTVITTDELHISEGVNQARHAEKWESCFVRIEDVTITSMPNSNNEFYVNNSTAPCQIDDQCFPRTGFSWPTMSVGNTWARIQGVVDFSFDYFGLNPRDMQDIIREDTVANATIAIDNGNGELGMINELALRTSRLKINWYLSEINAEIKIDPTRIIFQGISLKDDCILSMQPEVSVSANGDIITISYRSQEPIFSSVDDSPLFYLKMEPLVYGEARIDIQSFVFDNTPINSLYGGKLLTRIPKKIAYLNLGREGSSKNSFNPELGEKITIEYGCKAGASGVNTRAIVRIYDAQGRLVATPVNKSIENALGIEKIQWDGRDTNMKMLPIGLYYCHLEVIDRASGAKENTVQPIVIKSTLK